MKKKLWLIFGPALCAGMLLLLFLGSPFLTKIKYSKKTLQQAASSQAANVFKGGALKQQAFSGQYVPFFGSSELSRFDPLHPSILAAKYHRPYQPFLLGTAGTQSLSHYFSMQPANASLQGKKAVFIISPQWFVKQGCDKNAFGYYYSNLQVVDFILQTKDAPATRYAAKRVLSLTDISDHWLKKALEAKAKGQKLDWATKNYLIYKKHELTHEDVMFSNLKIKNRTKLIQKKAALLPDKYNLASLDQTAKTLGQKHTSGNPFEVSHTFWNKKLKDNYQRLKGKQAAFDYTQSVEFADFELVLQQFKQNKMQVLFVIPPVNAKWMAYTGLSAAMLQRFNQKITYQLKTQGFNNICDLSTNYQKYYMQDTIHLGWRGWLALDQQVKPFMAQTYQVPKYHLHAYFYSQKWQNLSGKQIEQLK